MRSYMPSLSLCRAGISIVSRFSATPGASDPVPGRAPLHAPRSTSRASAAILSPGTQSADVWGGRGTVVVPTGVGWRSGVAAVFWVFYNKIVFKDPNDDDVSVLYNKDIAAAWWWGLLSVVAGTVGYLLVGFDVVQQSYVRTHVVATTPLCVARRRRCDRVRRKTAWRQHSPRIHVWPCTAVAGDI